MTKRETIEKWHTSGGTAQIAIKEVKHGKTFYTLLPIETQRPSAASQLLKRLLNGSK